MSFTKLSQNKLAFLNSGSEELTSIEFADSQLNIDGNIIPTEDNTTDLGSQSKYFNTIYANDIQASNQSLTFGEDVKVSNVLFNGRLYRGRKTGEIINGLKEGYWEVWGVSSHYTFLRPRWKTQHFKNGKLDGKETILSGSIGGEETHEKTNIYKDGILIESINY